jgi:RNA polymerase sigma-B factor
VPAANSVERPLAADALVSAGDYSEQVPRLRYYASLPPAHPRRSGVREELILAFLPVVEHLARRHATGNPAEHEELVQVGTIGLINAIDRWDPERARGNALGYLIPCVRGEILRYFRDHTWSTRVPRRLKDLSVAIKHATEPLSQQLGHAPRASELAEYLGADREEIVDALEAQANYHATPLDAVAPDSGIPLAERIGELDKELDHVEYHQSLRPLLDQLPERERTILMLRFFGEMTQTQIGQHVGISQMHVSRVLSKTLEWLRASLLDDQLPQPRTPRRQPDPPTVRLQPAHSQSPDAERVTSCGETACVSAVKSRTTTRRLAERGSRSGQDTSPGRTSPLREPLTGPAGLTGGLTRDGVGAGALPDQPFYRVRDAADGPRRGDRRSVHRPGTQLPSPSTAAVAFDTATVVFGIGSGTAKGMSTTARAPPLPPASTFP